MADYFSVQLFICTISYSDNIIDLLFATMKLSKLMNSCDVLETVDEGDISSC